MSETFKLNCLNKSSIEYPAEVLKLFCSNDLLLNLYVSYCPNEFDCLTKLN